MCWLSLGLAACFADARFLMCKVLVSLLKPWMVITDLKEEWHFAWMDGARMFLCKASSRTRHPSVVTTLTQIRVSGQENLARLVKVWILSSGYWLEAVSSFQSFWFLIPIATEKLNLDPVSFIALKIGLFMTNRKKGVDLRKKMVTNKTPLHTFNILAAADKGKRFLFSNDCDQSLWKSNCTMGGVFAVRIERVDGEPPYCSTGQTESTIIGMRIKEAVRPCVIYRPIFGIPKSQKCISNRNKL
ncbi:hypothetical protein SELMODRAFT_418952 [Selaginella moellendorffii]|uniref:Uncharacterized protein n=1 Tax=Selaginella moellendorffii TaxID=88036 RepID=D8S7B8_SELML|nr:hypothetical protein SELMODRAFT_418952 [Selaginella moellendorffii]